MNTSKYSSKFNNNSQKQNKNISQALLLPTLCNLNPRSLYNKVDEFSDFVKKNQIDVSFISESFEREDLTLKDLIKLDNYSVISNVYQRKGRGGRPALVMNNSKYDIQNITNTLIQVPWGVEAVWGILTPKNVSQNSTIQKIACCALYSKPDTKHKSALLDHISDAYYLLNKKYGRGLHFIISGDTNDLKLDQILNLSPKFVQIVIKPTRNGKILDPILTTLCQYYQEPVCLQPLDNDKDKRGSKSDHKIVIARPINVINNKNQRVSRKVKVRPLIQSGIDQMQQWLKDQSWDFISSLESAHDKASTFQDILLQKYFIFFPEKTISINSDDQPWITQKLKTLDRKRKEFFKREESPLSGFI